MTYIKVVKAKYDEDHLSPKSFRHPAVLYKTTSSVGRGKDARKIIDYAGEILYEQTNGNLSWRQ